MGKAIIPTDAEIAAAKLRGEEEAKQEIRGASVRFDAGDRTMTLAFERGGALTFQVASIPELAGLDGAVLSQAELSAGGTTLICDAADVYLSVEGVVFRVLLGAEWLPALRTQAAKRLGSITSEARAAASRANGAKGGRPRKAPTAADVAEQASERVPFAQQTAPPPRPRTRSNQG